MCLPMKGAPEGRGGNAEARVSERRHGLRSTSRSSRVALSKNKIIPPAYTATRSRPRPALSINVCPWYLLPDVTSTYISILRWERIEEWKWSVGVTETPLASFNVYLFELTPCLDISWPLRLGTSFDVGARYPCFASLRFAWHTSPILLVLATSPRYIHYPAVSLPNVSSSKFIGNTEWESKLQARGRPICRPWSRSSFRYSGSILSKFVERWSTYFVKLGKQLQLS